MLIVEGEGVDILDSELQVMGYNMMLLVIMSCIAYEFQNLSSKVFKNRGKVYYQIKISLP